MVKEIFVNKDKYIKNQKEASVENGVEKIVKLINEITKE
jgi:hypothetical protein